MNARILLVGSQKSKINTLKKILQRECHTVLHIQNESQDNDIIEREKIDIIIFVEDTAIKNKIFSSLEKINMLNNRYIPIILILSSKSIEEQCSYILCNKIGIDDVFSYFMPNAFIIAHIENILRLKKEMEEVYEREELCKNFFLIEKNYKWTEFLLQENGRCLFINDSSNTKANTMVEGLSKNFLLYRQEFNAFKKSIQFKYNLNNFYDFFIVNAISDIKIGLETCVHIRQSQNTRYSPLIIILDKNQKNIKQYLKLGINDFIILGIDSRVEMELRARIQWKRHRYKMYMRNTIFYGFETANLDSLTGIHNRRWFDNRLEGLCGLKNKKKYKTIILIIMDIDHFKNINDKYGHAIGDFILKAIAARIKSETRSDTIFCRVGGEEFGFILYDLCIENAQIFAKRLKKIVSEKPFCVKSIDYRNCTQPLEFEAVECIGVTASFGLGVLDKKNDTSTTFFHKTDQALYHAKSMGRNRICIYETWKNKEE